MGYTTVTYAQKGYMVSVIIGHLELIIGTRQIALLTYLQDV